MRPRTCVLLALTLAASSAIASAQDGYAHGRLRYVEPGVTMQRATDTGAEEALGNEPFLPGDRVWTDASGRVEFQFPDGSSVRLDRRSKLDYTGHDEGRDERVALRLWSGSLLVHSRRGPARLEVETPAGLVGAAERSVVRVDVEGGEVRVSTLDGEATLDDGQSRVRVTAGERTLARWGGRAEDPQRFEADEWDDFARWDEQREVEVRVASADSRYLPSELEPYSAELDRNGDWRYDSGAGYVWVPQVDAGWQPYSNGRWTWTPYGWTWVPFDRWGWAPFHYGRWDYSASLGWYWMPGRTWGPAWVSWAVGGGYVGWCPLGRHDRPVVGWGEHRGHDDRLERAQNGPRGYAYGRGPMDAWSVVRSNELGHGNVARLRMPADRIDPTGFRVADTPSLQPTRDGSVLRPHAVPRMVSTKQTPGDFVRELGVDNKTTIPAPWTRGYGPPPAGADGARYGVPRERDPGQRESAGAANGGGSGSAGATGANPTGGVAQGGQATTAPRSSQPVPWFRPSGDGQRTGGATGSGAGANPTGANGQPAGQPANDGAARRRDDAAQRVPPVWSAGAPHSQGSSASSGDDHRSRSDGGAQPRSSGGESRGTGGGSAWGGSRPSGGQSRGASGGSNGGGSGSSSSGGSSRSSGSSDSNRPSSSGSSSSGGGHAVPRPHNR